MALSGSVTTTRYDNKIGINLSWTATQDAEKNTSSVSWVAKSDGGTNSNWWNAGPVTIKINGSTVLAITSRFQMNGNGVWQKSGTITVPHNEDGSKSFTVSIEAAIYYMAVNCTADATFTLNKIDRSPTAPTSCSARTEDGLYWAFGEQTTIKWTGATGIITGYEIQQWLSQDQTWRALRTVTGTSVTNTYTSPGIKAGGTVKYRVRALNGTLASSWTESNLLTFIGGVDLNIDGAWKPGSVWLNVNGTWTRAKRVWVKVDGVWQFSK